MKKGFTVIELLAVIIIIAIIGGIGFAIFDNVIHNMRLKAYKEQKNNIVLGAQKWLSDRRGTENYPANFPHTITLNELKNTNYIEKDICNQEERLIIDYNNSSVTITKNGKIFDYKVNIVNTGEECQWYIHQYKTIK